jgi:hypothetical protein
MACGRHARPASPGRAISFLNGRRRADRSTASGRLSLDGVVRAFIREKLGYRFTRAADAQVACVQFSDRRACL